MLYKLLKYLKWTSKPSYVAQIIFHNDLLAIHKIKTSLTYNYPAYVWMCVLKLSNVSIYKFHFYYIKNKYGNKSMLLFTYIDSLVYKIESKNVDSLIWVITLLSQNITKIQTH